VAHALREQQLKQTQLGEAAEESELLILQDSTFRKALTLEMYRALTAMYCDTLQYIGIVITNTIGALTMHLLILCQNSNSQNISHFGTHFLL